MKNKAKFNRTFQLSLLAIALGLFNQAWATDLTCSTLTGCKYDFHGGRDNTWMINNQSTSFNDTINVEVLPGNYQNIAKTDVGTIITDGESIASADALFRIRDLSNRDNIITFKSGVNATLKEDYPSSNLIDLWRATATLEKGVKLILEQNYAQLHNTTDAYGDDDDGNSAISTRNSRVDTEADIEINNNGANVAIESQESSNITSSNHRIIMNGENNIAYALFGRDTLTINNVNISGNRDKQFAFDIGNDDSETANINADHLNVSLNDKSGLMTNSDSTSSIVNFNHSNIKTGYGVLIFPLDRYTTNLNLQNSTLNATQALVSINDKMLLDGDGDDDDEVIDIAKAEVYQLNITGSRNSIFTGAIIENPEKPAKVETNLYLEESQWRFNQSSRLNHLTVNDSVVTFEPNSEYKTLTIKGNLTGNGTFNLNTNISENKGDKIIVEGTASGEHKLNVTDHGTPVANHKLTLVETHGGDAKFSLTNPNGLVDLGAYKYGLAKEGDNWVLANSRSAITPTPPTPVNPAQPTNPPLPETKLLSDLANAQVSLRQAQLLLLENELSGIHQRLGEVKNGEKGNVWVRNVNSREKLTALSTGDSQTSGFKQNVHSLQVGADAAVSDNFRLGGFVGRSQANVDFNGNYGDSKVRSHSVGLYATYLADNGIYVDNIAKYSRLKSQYDHKKTHHYRHYNTYTLSSEFGKQFKLSSDWVITPQAQLAWTHIQGKDNEDSLSSIYSRVGVRVAKSFALANGWNLQPYAEINGITSRNNDSKIHHSNTALNVEDSRGRFESVLGVNAGVANHRIGLEVSRADGKRYDKPYQIQALYRYHW
ncbi:autotransporter outer membrane beta-barrel domain-containing protein [Rodentibacter trehalosifermentans]|uniref:Autotransporter outer membrane beta-barrel domain-containing protein n=1 Tax=Rodentibacter trehalosifermentans TaxID=1908263 RepID=A0A1V3IYE5_9PAST|nr:autotransporter outer membrane beta-barrel domain-containing protein [Rodentibacter trehalosifermentans]OOF47386.1 autotransporter outer membrane beta-barrel domain-containing protein [Rodentibacter trehalosifermentans]